MENLTRQGFIAEGTTCGSCSEIIQRQAKKIDGVKEIHFDHKTEKGYILFDKNKTNIDTILYKIEEKGYNCFILDEIHKNKPTNSLNSIFGWFFAILGIIIIGYFLFSFVEKIQLPQITQNMGYGLLFVVGLLTGFHCIAMCGGFVVSYTAKDAQGGKKSHTSHIKYGIGKLLSYTLMGAIFGLIGSIVAFTPTMRGIAGILAGIFLILFGLKMLNIFHALRSIEIRTPKFISKFIGKESSHSGPFFIGLLNGLMLACGPLQAIYIMAAGTGSLIEGAKIAFIFALGTLPVMLGFGYLASLISSKMTKTILKFSGIAVIVLGLIMLNNGLVLTGKGYDFKSLTQPIITLSNSQSNLPSNNIAVQKDGYQEISMDVTADGWKPDTFVLKKGVPVHWIINGKEITSCNSAIQVSAYNLKFDVKQGEQTIEFTPQESGTISWSCWMGMIPGRFIVKDDISDQTVIKTELSKASPLASSGGGCGCGMKK
jgi:uncharacterized protein